MHLQTKLYSARGGLGSLFIGLAAWLAVVVALDPAGDYPARWAGPGLTVDERFNVAEGTRLADRFLAGDFAGFREVVNGLTDHPPLGRLWIGLFHEAAWLLSPPLETSSPFSVACARTAPAAAFGCLVFLVGNCARRWYGSTAGMIAAASLVLMPRLFGHAHLAALETFINLFYFATVAWIATYWTGSTPPTWRQAAGGGILFGLALLTKIQAVLLPIPILIWALITWRQRAFVPLLFWGLTGGLVFLGGWTWLWDDPLAHLQTYLGSTTNRAQLYVWYFGQKIADRDVPWHYPWILFVTTIPLGLQLLGAWGLCGGSRSLWKSPREMLLLSCLLFPLIVFSLPRIAVYDGERLFLVVFPLWGIFIGRGGMKAWEWLRGRCRPWQAGAILAVGLTAQAIGMLAVAPCYLSYYNILVGGLRGANTLGLQTTYWGDSLTRDLLRETAQILPAGAILDVSPVLEPGQLSALLSQSPPLAKRDLKLRAYTDANWPAPRYVLVFFRQQDLLPNWNDGPPNGKVLAEVQRDGVRLAALFEFSVAQNDP